MRCEPQQQPPPVRGGAAAHTHCHDRAPFTPAQQHAVAVWAGPGRALEQAATRPAHLGVGERPLSGAGHGERLRPPVRGDRQARPDFPPVADIPRRHQEPARLQQEPRHRLLAGTPAFAHGRRRRTGREGRQPPGAGHGQAHALGGPAALATEAARGWQQVDPVELQRPGRQRRPGVAGGGGLPDGVVAGHRDGVPRRSGRMAGRVAATVGGGQHRAGKRADRTAADPVRRGSGAGRRLLRGRPGPAAVQRPAHHHQGGDQGRGDRHREHRGAARTSQAQPSHEARMRRANRGSPGSFGVSGPGRARRARPRAAPRGSGPAPPPAA